MKVSSASGKRTIDPDYNERKAINTSLDFLNELALYPEFAGAKSAADTLKPFVEKFPFTAKQKSKSK